MFPAAYRSSSGALNCIWSFWFMYTCGERPLSRPCQGLDNGRHPSTHNIYQQLHVSAFNEATVRLYKIDRNVLRTHW